MEPSSDLSQPHGLSEKLVMYLGLFASTMCCILGYPCSPDDFVVYAFRATCIGYFISNLSGLLLQRGPLQIGILRIGLLVNSISSWLISAYWCVGFGEWCILMLLEHSFMIFGAMVLVKTHVELHLLITFAGSLLCYLMRQPAEMAAAPEMSKLWVAGTVSVVMILVGGIWYSGDSSIAFLQRRIKLVTDIMTMSPEELTRNSTPPTMRTPSTGSRPFEDFLHKDEHSDGGVQGLQLLNCIGQGSFGKVYSATYRDKKVAVKIMRWEGAKLKRIDPMHEAKICLQISHPNLVQAFDFFLRDCQSEAKSSSSTRELLIIQEWCDRGTLCSFCDRPRHDALGLRQTKSIMLDVSRACEYLHAQEIIHGDLTSNNVLLQTKVVEESPKRVEHDTQELDFTCKVCDFGLARVLDEGVSTLMTSQLGTVTHMPPELMQMENRRLTKRADVFALGMLLYQILLGVLPYAGKTAPQIIIFISRGSCLELNDEIPEDVRKIFKGCTARVPEDRPHAGELVRRLTELDY